MGKKDNGSAERLLPLAHILRTGKTGRVGENELNPNNKSKRKAITFHTVAGYIMHPTELLWGNDREAVLSKTTFMQG